MRALVTLPMVLPPVVGGIALLYAFGRQGFAGQILYDLTGWRLVFTTAGAILAQTFVAMPFLVVTAEAAFRTLDRRTEEVAATLGPDPAYRSGGQAQRVALARALAPVGNRARVRVAGPVPLVAEVTTAAVAELGLADGGTVWASVKATDVEVYPA